jgi:hypothetical protein
MVACVAVMSVHMGVLGRCVAMAVVAMISVPVPVVVMPVIVPGSESRPNHFVPQKQQDRLPEAPEPSLDRLSRGNSLGEPPENEDPQDHHQDFDQHELRDAEAQLRERLRDVQFTPEELRQFEHLCVADVVKHIAVTFG